MYETIKNEKERIFELESAREPIGSHEIKTKAAVTPNLRILKFESLFSVQGPIRSPSFQVDTLPAEEAKLDTQPFLETDEVEQRNSEKLSNNKSLSLDEL